MLYNTRDVCHLQVQEAITATKGPAQHFWLQQRVVLTDTLELSYYILLSTLVAWTLRVHSKVGLDC